MSRDNPRIIRYFNPSKLDLTEEALSSQEQETLDTVNQKVAAGESLDAILSFLFDATRDIFPCDRIGLAFVADHEQRVVSYGERALYEPVLLKKGYAEDLWGSSLAAVFKSGNTRIIYDLEQYLERHPNSTSTKLLVEEGVRSSMTCPLVVEGRRVGFLFRSSRRPRAYDEHQVALHQALAERLSQAVEKAWRIEQLVAANNAYTEMLGFVSHELRSPLGSLVMEGKVLSDGYLGELSPEQRQQVGKMVSKAEYLLNLIREYLDLARIESGKLQPNIRKVDFVSEVLDPAIGVIRAQLDAKGMKLRMAAPEHPDPVYCDAELLMIVMVNLLGNAAKYGAEGGTVRVRIEQSDSQFFASVWNSGPGFPESEKHRLFRRFSRLQSPELLKQKGTGVGLYTSWQIVQAHRGKLRAQSEQGQWAEFSFSIPQALPQQTVMPGRSGGSVGPDGSV
jgi:signal transduction histidine kinase